MKNLLECKNITKTYGSKTALKDFSLSLSDGDIYGLVGPNGAGKSTFLKILAGYIEDYRGDVEIFGESANLSKVRGNMGFLIENPSFYSYMSGRKNLAYQCSIKGIDIKEEINELAGLFKVDTYLDKKVKGYSTGMRQRLGIVAAVMNRPKILILDEPINGLDPEGIVELRNFLLKINREWNTAVIVSSHILNELSMIATKIGFIKDGELIEECSIEELREKSKSYFEVIFREEDLSKACALIESELNITDYIIKNDSLMEIYQELESDTLLKKLTGQNIYPEAFERKTKSLEDYYIEIMGGNI